MAAVRHLAFAGGSRGTNHKGPFMVTIWCKNFVIIDIAVWPAPVALLVASQQAVPATVTDEAGVQGSSPAWPDHLGQV